MRKFNDYFFRRYSTPVSSFNEMAYKKTMINGKMEAEVRRVPLFFDQEDITFLRFFPPQFRAEAYYQLLNDVLLGDDDTKTHHTFKFARGQTTYVFRDIPVGPKIFKGGDKEHPMGIREKLSRTVDDDVHQELKNHSGVSTHGKQWLKSPAARDHYRSKTAAMRAEDGLVGYGGDYGHDLTDVQVGKNGRKNSAGFLVPEVETIRRKLADLYRSAKYGFSPIPGSEVYGRNSIKSADPEAKLIPAFKPAVRGVERDHLNIAGAGHLNFKTPYQRFDSGLDDSEDDHSEKFYVYSGQKLEKAFSPFLKNGQARKDETGNIIFNVNKKDDKDKIGTPMSNIGALRKIDTNTGKATWVAEKIDSKGVRTIVPFTSYMPITPTSKMYDNDTFENFYTTKVAHRALKQMLRKDSDGNLTGEQERAFADLVHGIKECNERSGRMTDEENKLIKKSKAANQEASKPQLTPEEEVNFKRINLVKHLYPLLLKVLPTIPAFQTYKGETSDGPVDLSDPKKFIDHPGDDTGHIIKQCIRTILGKEEFEKALDGIIDAAHKGQYEDGTPVGTVVHNAHDFNQHDMNSDLLGHARSNYSGAVMMPNHNSRSVRTKGLGDIELLNKYNDYLFVYAMISGKKLYKNKFKEGPEYVQGPAERAFITWMKDRTPGDPKTTALRELEDDVIEFAILDIKRKASGPKIGLDLYDKKDKNGIATEDDWKKVLNGAKTIAREAINAIAATRVLDTFARRKSYTAGMRVSNTYDGKGGETRTHTDTGEKTSTADLAGLFDGGKPFSWHGQAESPVFMNSLTYLRSLVTKRAAEFKVELAKEKGGLIKTSSPENEAMVQKMNKKLIDSAVAYQIAADLYDMEIADERKRNPNFSMPNEDKKEKEIEERSRAILNLEVPQNTGMKSAASEIDAVPSGLAPNDKVDAFFNNIKNMSAGDGTAFRDYVGIFPTTPGQPSPPADVGQRKHHRTLQQLLARDDISKDHKEIINKAYANIEEPESTGTAPVVTGVATGVVKSSKGLGAYIKSKSAPGAAPPPAVQPVVAVQPETGPMKNDWLLNLKSKYNQ